MFVLGIRQIRPTQHTIQLHLLTCNSYYSFYFIFLRCRLTGVLATACGDDGVRVFKEDAASDPDQLVFYVSAHVPKAHSQDINCVAWNPKEVGLLATCSDNGEIAIWNYQSDA